MNQEFTLKEYQDLLIHFRKSHEIVPFRDYNTVKEKNSIVLRHDIDYSLKHAKIMAQIESDLGVKSTYFLLFSSPFYNLLDQENIGLAKDIAEMGHEIGLHYDVTVMMKGNRKNPESLLHSQVEILSNIANQKVETIAMHNPSISGEDIFRNTPYRNAYQAEFVEEMAYFSDSCMAWRNGFIEHLKSNSFPEQFQFLIHPILWTDDKMERFDKLEWFSKVKMDELNGYINEAKEIWKNHSGVKEHNEKGRDPSKGGIDFIFGICFRAFQLIVKEDFFDNAFLKSPESF